MSVVCVDASFAAKWVLPEQGHRAALARLAEWEAGGTEVAGPPHLFSEVTAAICAWVFLKRITREEGTAALRTFLQAPIQLYAYPELYVDALALATVHGVKRSYDAEYVALAAYLGCELWTTDRALLSNFGRQYSWIRSLPPEGHEGG